MENMSHPKVSVVCIAVHPEEFLAVKEYLKKQSYQDYEFIGEVGGTIPDAWDRAVKRAVGDILVFTETDAKPVNERWLEELVSAITDNKTIIKGLEITGTPLDFSNLAAPRSAFDDNEFDRRFKWAEDTELFSRLKLQGYRFRQIEAAPVIHLRKNASKRYIRRAFRYGLYWARLRHCYPEPVELANVATSGKALIAALLNMLGLLIGSIIYLPERRHRKRI
jgi:GT2 family glycosyltransferase